MRPFLVVSVVGQQRQSQHSFYMGPSPIGRHFIHTSTPNQNRTVGETENEGVEYTLSIYLLSVTLTSTDLRML